MSESAKIRWGILATGNIAKTFAKALPKSDTGTLVAVASRSQEKADVFAKEFGNVRAHGSYEALLADDKVDAVYLATPHTQHVEWAIKTVRAGKHLLCEKPIGVNASGALALYDGAAAAGVFCMEAYMYRCHPQTKKLVDLIKGGAIGKVQQVDATFAFRAGGDSPDYEGGRLFADKLAGGGILDVGGYTTSIVRLVAGAASDKPFLEPNELSGHAKKADNGVDEWATASLKFDNGVLATCRTGVRLNAGQKVIIHGDKGTITLDNPFIPGKEGEPVSFTLESNGEEETVEVRGGKPLYALEADAFAAGVRDGQPPYPAMSVADSLGNARTLERWREASGVTYSFETADDYAKTTAAGEPLKRGRTGTMPTLDVGGVTVSKLVMGVDNQDRFDHAAVMFDAYFEAGGNAFDTASVYGGRRSENLGNWLKLRGVRDDCAVICKGAHTPYNFPVIVRMELQRQLDWLGTDRCEFYFLHRDNEDVPVGEWVDALDELANEGLIRGVYGGSNWSLDRVKAANEYAQKNGRRGFGGVSQNLSLAELVDPVWPGCVSAHTAEWLAWLEQTQTANFSWSSQARGFFVPDRDLSEPEIERCWVSDANLKRRERCFELAKEKQVEPIGVAAAWVLAQPFPSLALIGPRTPAELRSSLPALSIELTDAERDWLDLKTDSRQ